MNGKISNKSVLKQPLIHFYTTLYAQQALNHILQN